MSEVPAPPPAAASVQATAAPPAAGASGTVPPDALVRPVAAVASRGSPPPLAWRVWPLVEPSAATWSLMALLAAFCVGAGWWTARIDVGLVCGAVVIAATWRFFVPTFYETSAMGISRFALGHHRRIPWMAIERYEVRGEGVYLAASGVPMEPLRGTFIPWGRHRAELLTALEYYVARARRLSQRPDASGSTAIAEPKSGSAPVAPAAPASAPRAET